MPDHDDGDGHDGPSGPVLLAAAAVVVVVGLVLSAKIRDMSRIQDCVLAGHTNCAPIESPER